MNIIKTNIIDKLLQEIIIKFQEIHILNRLIMIKTDMIIV